MSRRLRVTVVVTVLVALAACGAPSPRATGGSAAVTTGDPTAPTSWAMPDLVGLDLQTAQDTVQQLSGYAIAVTTAKDATGRNRDQVFDRDWRVCSQSVAPKAEITTDTMIDFAVVLLAEPCP